VNISKCITAVLFAVVIAVGVASPAGAATPAVIVKYKATLTPQFGQGGGHATAKSNGTKWTAAINATGMTQNTYTYAIVLPDGTEYDVCSFATAPNGSGACSGKVVGLTGASLPDGTFAYTIAGGVVPTTGGQFVPA
jgi:hypothetical protein